MEQRCFRTFTQIFTEYFFYFGEKTISLLMSFSDIENPALCELRLGLLRVVTNLSKSLIEAKVKFCRLIVICIRKHLKIKKFIGPWWGHKKYWTLLFILGKIKNQNKRVQRFCRQWWVHGCRHPWHFWTLKNCTNIFLQFFYHVVMFHPSAQFEWKWAGLAVLFSR